MLGAMGKVESTLTGTPIDFMVFERVVWRGGIVKASKTKPDHPQQKHLLLTGRYTISRISGSAYSARKHYKPSASTTAIFLNNFKPLRNA
jgi:hypothetical protein